MKTSRRGFLGALLGAPLVAKAVTAQPPARATVIRAGREIPRYGVVTLDNLGCANITFIGRSSKIDTR